jgi:hypothetical protein
MQLNIIDEKKIKSSDSKDTYIKINIEPNSLSKFPMQIMYYCERGFRNFILVYSNENAKYSFDKIAVRILSNIFDIIEKEEVKIGLGGFARCIFNQYFLKEDIKFKYEDKFFYHDYYYENVEEDFEQTLDCIDCKLNQTCPGIYKKYVKKYREEIAPIYNNLDLKEYYDKIFENLHDNRIKEKFELCINDYYENNYLDERKLFLKERISKGSDELKEGFFYNITNSKKDTEEIINLIDKITSKDTAKIKKYLEKSGHFLISFEVLTDDLLRSKVEIGTSNLNKEEIEELFDICNFTLNEDISDIDFIKIQLNENAFEIVELGRNICIISSVETKVIFKNYDLEQKRMFLKFLNSMHKDIKNAKLRYKYEHSILVSTAFETTLKENTLKLRLLGVLFTDRLNHLFEKKMLNLWFEIYEFQNEKYGFNQMPKLPKRYPEIEERVYDN